MSQDRPNAGKTLRLWRRVTVLGPVCCVLALAAVSLTVKATVSHPGDAMFLAFVGCAAAIGLIMLITVRWADAIRRRPDFAADERDELVARLRAERNR